MNIFDVITGFQWDKGNRDKNWKKHKVSNNQCEEIFFNIPIIVEPDIKHSKRENRYYVLGKTNKGRLIFLVFTIRSNLIRVITARDMTKRERKVYNEAEEKIT